MCSAAPALHEFKPRSVARLSITTPSSWPVNWQWLSFNQSHRTCLIKLLLSWADTAVICQVLWLLKCSSFKSRPEGLLRFLSEFKQNLKQRSLLPLLPVVSSCVLVMNPFGHLCRYKPCIFFVGWHDSKPKICTLQHHFVLSKQLIDGHCYSN